MRSQSLAIVSAFCLCQILPRQAAAQEPRLGGLLKVKTKAGGVVALTALAAGSVPAMRAARLQPVIAMRED